MAPATKNKPKKTEQPTNQEVNQDAVPDTETVTVPAAEWQAMNDRLDALTKQQNELFNMFETKEERQTTGGPDLAVNAGELEPHMLFMGILTETTRSSMTAYGGLSNMRDPAILAQATEDIRNTTNALYTSIITQFVKE